MTNSRQRTYTLTGTNTLLMANGRMADPNDEHAMAYQLHTMAKPNVRSKKVKEKPELLKDWLAEEKRIQFFGLLYWDESIGFHIPSDNILYMVREAYFGYGSTSKGGDRLLSAIETDREAYSLEYDGPTTPEERWQAGLYRQSMVSNRAMGGAKVRVLQPLFKGWKLTFTLKWAEEVLETSFLGKGKAFSVRNLSDRLVAQGHTFGLGAYRKSGNYGNFEVELRVRGSEELR